MRLLRDSLSISISGDSDTIAAGSSTLGLQPLGERQRQIAAGRVAGQHDLVGLVTQIAQPLVSVVAVVERLADGVLRDHPVVDHQHGRVGVLGDHRGQPAVRVRSARQKRAAVHVQHDAALPVGGQHALGAHQLGGAVRQLIVARTVPGAGNSAREAKSTRPHGQGRNEMWLPIARVGRIVSRAPSQASRPAMLGPSSTTSTGAPSETGYRRVFSALPAPMCARGEPETFVGAVMSHSYAVVGPGPTGAPSIPGNLA